MATALDYDRLATDYAANRRVHPGVLAALVATGRLGPTSRGLEVGCGSGNYARALAETVGCALSGVEPSASMLARAATTSGVMLRQGRAEALPFADGAFDLVFSVDVIHHVEDRAAFFREAFRVLAADGKLCTVTDSADDIRRRVPLSSHFPETVVVELDRYPPIETLREEMAAGFGAIAEERAELAYPLTDPDGYRARAYSSLHLIDDAVWRRGMDRLESDLAAGPLAALSLYTLLWGERRGGPSFGGGGVGNENKEQP